jgi:hypothetical protein
LRFASSLLERNVRRSTVLYTRVLYVQIFRCIIYCFAYRTHMDLHIGFLRERDMELNLEPVQYPVVAVTCTLFEHRLTSTRNITHNAFHRHQRDDNNNNTYSSNTLAREQSDFACIKYTTNWTGHFLPDNTNTHAVEVIL